MWSKKREYYYTKYIKSSFCDGHSLLRKQKSMRAGRRGNGITYLHDGAKSNQVEKKGFENG